MLAEASAPGGVSLKRKFLRPITNGLMAPVPESSHMAAPVQALAVSEYARAFLFLVRDWESWAAQLFASEFTISIHPVAMERDIGNYYGLWMIY